MRQTKNALRGAIALYFVIGTEILIMISPAAGFFYTAYIPFLRNNPHISQGTLAWRRTIDEG